MEVSVFLARIIGPLFILIAVGVLLNVQHYRAMAADFLNSPPLYYLTGTTAFIVGMVLIIHHNLWVADWRVTITVIGWMSLVKGIMRILLPTLGPKAASRFMQSDKSIYAGAIALLFVGAFLAYNGFGG